jgi:hypothetical protein
VAGNTYSRDTDEIFSSPFFDTTVSGGWFNPTVYKTVTR